MLADHLADALVIEDNIFELRLLPMLLDNTRNEC
jgi:hypothetical protein